MKIFFTKEISIKNFMILFIILNILYLFPFILSPFLFMDDNVRIVVGNPDWGWQGRPLADLMMYFLNSNSNKIVNLYPFPLLLSLLFYFYTVYYIVKNNITKLEIGYLLPFLFILCNALFVHNLLYKYDSAPMIFGISSALFAFFYESKNKYLNVLTPVLFLIMALSLYQPCFNIYLSLLVSGYIFNLKNKKDYFKKFAIHLSALILYVIFVSILGLKSSRSHIINLLDSNSLNIIFNKFFFFIKELFLTLPLLIVIPSICIIILFLINIFLLIKKESSIIKKCYLIVSPFLIFVSLWGGLLIIKEPLIQPREFINFGILLFLITLFIIKKYKHTITYIFTLILLIGSFSFGYQSVNTLKEQKEFENQILTNVYSNIIENPEIYNSYKIYINGKLPKSLILQNNESNSKIIKRFIEPADKWVIRYTLIRMGINNIQDGFSDDNKEQLKIINNMKPIIQTKFYNIYRINNSSVIYFKIKKGVSKDS